MNSPTVPAVAQLSVDDARALTDEIRKDAQTLWLKLLRAYEGDAHGSLGYSSWADYCATEFDFSKTRSYRLLQAARVIEIAELPMGNSKIPNERVAREFTPLLDDPRALRETHTEAVATAPVNSSGGASLTAGHVREVVRKYIKKPEPSTSRKTPQRASGIAIRPGVGEERDDEPVNLNDAVTGLKRAVNGDINDADAAVEALRKSAAAGLYRPGNDTPAAVKELVELVAVLIAMARETTS